MACAACERRRQAMKAMLNNAAAHAARLLALRRGGKTDGPTAEPATEGGQGAPQAGTSTRAKPAGKANPAHGKRRVAKAPRGRSGA